MIMCSEGSSPNQVGYCPHACTGMGQQVAGRGAFSRELKFPKTVSFQSLTCRLLYILEAIPSPPQRTPILTPGPM